jgi:SAM-dependent methyltransferase
MLNKIVRKIKHSLISFSLRAPYSHRSLKMERCLKKIQVNKFFCTLDLGSGQNPRNPFNAERIYGVDIRSYESNDGAVKKCNLGYEAIPFAGNYFDSVTAYDILEHIPRVTIARGETVFPMVDCMNEIWRVLKVEGYFFSVTPCYPMNQAFQDPTHVNIMTEDTLRLYFGEKAWARIYGFEGSFRILDEGWRRSHYWCLMQKTTDKRIKDKESPQRN